MNRTMLIIPAFVLLICYALIACLLLGYLKSQGAWLWAFIFVVGIVAAMIVTSIPMSEPLTKGVLMTAILQQQDHAVNILAAAIAAFIGAALGGAMSGRS